MRYHLAHPDVYYQNFLHFSLTDVMYWILPATKKIKVRLKYYIRIKHQH